jgi:hypothetical protein
MDGGAGTERRIVLPRAPAAPGALRVDTAVLVDALSLVAAADGAAEVGAAALRVLARLDGVRAGLVARSPHRGADPVVLTSFGYDCSTMGAGAVLPLSAGLPVTEAVRTGSTRVVGPGPSWVAVPAGAGAALLLSLTGPPPSDEGVDLLERLGAAAGAALTRAGRAEQARVDLLVLEQGLAGAGPSGRGVLVHSRPFRGPLTGDVVEVVPDGAVRWVLVADVAGRGHPAAVAADRLRAAFRAAAPGSAGPSAVLARLDRALAGGEEDFATALVLRAAGTSVTAATAGHPPPLLVPGGRVAVPPAAPLGLRLPGAWLPAGESRLDLPPGGCLIAATDGLVDRGVEVDLDAVVGALRPGLAPDALLDAVLAACEAIGPAEDDVTVLVLTP